MAMSEIATYETFDIIIDRIEGEFAVCEFPDMTMKNIKLSDIPFKVREKNTLVVRYTETDNIEVLSLKKVKNTRRPIVKLIRFT